MKITPLTPACLPPGVQLWLRPGAGSALTADGQADGQEDGQVLSAQELVWGEALAPAGRRRYWQSRAAMRQVLAAALDCTPQAVPLRSPPGQPPDLAGGWVSLSHSGDGLLVGYAPRPIGVDLEWAERPLEPGPLARRFFPADECAQLLQLPPAQRRRAFLESWVRKEAAIKWQADGRLASDLVNWHWDGGAAQLTHGRAGWQPQVTLCEREGWLCAAVGDAVERGIWG